MPLYISQVFLATILIIDYTSAIPLSDFISFGSSNGDTQFSRIHRGASPHIRISPRFPYFNETYIAISVSSFIMSLLVRFFEYIEL